MNSRDSLAFFTMHPSLIAQYSRLLVALSFFSILISLELVLAHIVGDALKIFRLALIVNYEVTQSTLFRILIKERKITLDRELVSYIHFKIISYGMLNYVLKLIPLNKLT